MSIDHRRDTSKVNSWESVDCDSADQRSAWRLSGAYLLGLIALIGVSLEADRNLFSVALEPIKREFHLSDSQLGAINGLAFAVLFGIASIPIARLAERMGPRRIIGASVAVWSAFTAATAFATGFGILFATRILVGIGEAGCNPALQSVIAARFSPQQRSGALAVMCAGNYIGLLVGMAVGGVLIDSLGWRRTFLVAGLTGVVLTPLVWKTLYDPARETSSIRETMLREVWAILRVDGMGHFLAASGLMSLTTSATVAWAPAFYARYYGMNASQVGSWVGVIFGGGAVVGSMLGGAIVNRLTRTRRDAGLSFVFWTIVVFTPPSIVAFLVDNRLESMGALLFSVVVGCLPAGPIYSTLYDLVEARHRSVAAALSGVAAVVIGGSGPFLVGVISDLAGAGGRGGLRVGLVVINCFNIWILWHVFALLSSCRRRFMDRLQLCGERQL